MVTARDGQQALEQVKEHTPDLVLLDVRPFGVDELPARVRAVLRRAPTAAQQDASALRTTITVGDLAMDVAQRTVTMAGREVALTPLEYRHLALLVQHAGRMVLQESLLEYSWGEQYLGESHLLRVNINRLRCKLEPDPGHPRIIHTRGGVGYLLTGP